MSRLDKQILSLLPTGADDPITAAELKKLCGVTRVRDITFAIHLLRKQGQVILSNGKGYFKPADKQEIRSFVRTMRSRQREIAEATRSAVKAMKEG